VRTQHCTFGEYPSHRAITITLPPARAGIDFEIKQAEGEKYRAARFHKGRISVLANK
jgi:hypothetical protein